MWAFFLDSAFRMLIGWAGKLRSRDRFGRKRKKEEEEEKKKAWKRNQPLTNRNLDVPHVTLPTVHQITGVT